MDAPLLYGPQAYARLPDGRLVVLDAGEERLVVLAADSDRVEARFGPNGQGPGEIWSAAAALWPGPDESVWVLDPGNQRLTRFSLSGAVEEERPVEFGGMGGITLQRPGTYEPFFWKFFLGGPSGLELTDSIGRFDADSGRVVFFAPMPPRVEGRRDPRGRAPIFAPMGWFAPVGDGAVTGRNDSGRLRHYSDAGALVGIIEIPMRASPIDPSDEPAILEEYLGAIRTTGPRPTVAEHYPLFNIMWPVSDSLFALQETDRSTPVGEPRIPEGRIVWRVFSITGHYAGAILFPEDVALPFWIDGDRIIATHRDSLGVATIESYRLDPGVKP
jgi:hypothetical protein